MSQQLKCIKTYDQIKTLFHFANCKEKIKVNKLKTACAMSFKQSCFPLYHCKVKAHFRYCLEFSLQGWKILLDQIKEVTSEIIGPGLDRFEDEGFLGILKTCSLSPNAVHLNVISEQLTASWIILGKLQLFWASISSDKQNP